MMLEPAPDVGARPVLRPLRILAYGAGLLIGATALVALFPVISGAPWRNVWQTVADIPVGALGVLVALWAAGLLMHTVTLTAALPGLSHRRALLLSLTGSAVANVLPLGGAAGVALNYRMTRRWGFSAAGFASYTVVTNLWDVLTKLCLPVLVLPLLLAGLPVGTGLRHLVLAGAVALPCARNPRGAADPLATVARSAGRAGGTGPCLGRRAGAERVGAAQPGADRLHSAALHAPGSLSLGHRSRRSR